MEEEGINRPAGNSPCGEDSMEARVDEWQICDYEGYTRNGFC